LLKSGEVAHEKECEFQASLGYTRPCLSQKQNKKFAEEVGLKHGLLNMTSSGRIKNKGTGQWIQLINQGEALASISFLGSYYVAQASPELLGSRDLPVSASGAAETRVECHHASDKALLCISKGIRYRGFAYHTHTLRNTDPRTESNFSLLWPLQSHHPLPGPSPPPLGSESSIPRLGKLFLQRAK
jgi:hypothetical protein